MAESIKYKNPDTYHDAGNVYDSTQGKTQEELNKNFEKKSDLAWSEWITLNDYFKYSCNSMFIILRMTKSYPSAAAAWSTTVLGKLPENLLPILETNEHSLSTGAKHTAITGFISVNTSGDISLKLWETAVSSDTIALNNILIQRC